MAFFEAKAITMTFGGLTAVNKVNLSIEKGMIASVIGPNGAGKTTFFQHHHPCLRPDKRRDDF